MPTQIPITFRSHPLPIGFSGTPEELKNAIVARLVAEGTDSIAFFVTGSTEPTSNMGPWLKDGKVWYVWDDVTGGYVAQALDPASIKIHYGPDAPDPAVYNMWVELNGSGKGIGIKTYYSGSWRSVYEDQFAQYSTTTQMNTAISNAVNSAVSDITIGKASFSAKPDDFQVITFAGPGTQSGIVSFGDVVFDPDSCFSANEYNIPASGYYFVTGAMQISVPSGTPTDLDIVGFINANTIGYPIGALNNEAGPDTTNGRTIVGSGYAYLSAGTKVKMDYSFTSNAAATVTIDPAATVLSGFRVR